MAWSSSSVRDAICACQVEARAIVSEAIEQRAAPSTRSEVVMAGAGKAAEWLTLVLLLTAVPRVLGPIDYGTFGLALSLVALGSAAAALGGPATIARLVAEAPQAERPGLARALAERAARWRGAWAGLVLVCASVLVVVDPERFRLEVVALVVLAVTLDIAATLAFHVALALGRTLAWSVRYALQNAALVVGAVALYETFGLNGALAAIPLSIALALAVGVAGIGDPMRRAPAGAAVPELATRFSVLQGVSGFLYQFTHRGGVVAVALMASSSDETGYTALAVGIAIALMYVPWQFFTVSLPRVSALGAKDAARGDVELRRLAWASLGVVGPVSILAAAFAEPILSTLVDTAFDAAQPALVPALAVAPLAVLTGWAGAFSTMHLRPGERVWIAGTGAIAFLVALALVPALGSVGALTALLVATAVSAATSLVRLPGLREPGLALACVACSATTLFVGSVL